MDRFVSFFKAHPLWIIGGVVALIVFWYIAGRGGSSDAAAYGVIRSGPTDAQVAANSAENLARITTNAQTVQGQNAIELAKVTGAYTVQLAGIDSTNVQAALSTSKQISEIQADRDVNITGIIGKTQTDLMHIQADATTTVAGLQTNLARDVANIDFEKFKFGTNAAQVASDNAAASAVEVARINAQNALDLYDKKVNASQQWWPYPDVLASMLGTPGTGPQTANSNTITNNAQTIYSPA